MKRAVAEQMLAPFRAGIRSKLFLCLLVIISAYSIYFTNNPYIKLISIYSFLIASEFMMFLWGKAFANHFALNIFRRKTISWKELPMFSDFREIAKNLGVKLNKNRPFGIMENLDNAFTNPLTRQIIFGDKLIQRLSEGERLVLFGHELTHLKDGHNIKLMVWTLFVPSLVIFPLRFTSAPSIVINIVALASFFMTFTLVSWHNEYNADLGGATLAGLRNMLSLLRQLMPRKCWKRESESHPSISNRLLKLKKRKAYLLSHPRHL